MYNLATITKEEIYNKKPEELTMLLYMALVNNIKQAIEAIRVRDFHVVNAKLTKAVDIIERLGVGLNFEAGIIADQLQVLYEYMVDKLVTANITKSVEDCEEVLAIVERISDSWQEAMDKVGSGQAPMKSQVRQGSYYDQAEFATPGENLTFDLRN